MSIFRKILLWPVGAFILLVFLAWWAMHSPLDSFPNRLWQNTFWRFPLVERLFLSSNSVRNFFGFVYAGDARYQIGAQDLNVLIHTQPSVYLPMNFTSDVQSLFLSTNSHRKVTITSSGDINSSTNFNTSANRLPTTINIYIVDPEFSHPYLSRFPKSYGAVAISSQDIIVFLADISDSPYYRYSLRALLAHEIGHLLGLKHNDNSDCVMYPLHSTISSDYNMRDYFDTAIIAIGEPQSADNFAAGTYKWTYCPEEKKRLEKVLNPPLVRLDKYPSSYYYASDVY